MKVAILSMVGNVGKSTIAANMFMPRMNNPKFFSIETLNSGAEMDGVDVEKMHGKKFGALTDELMLIDDAIIDVGATNFGDFAKLMQQFSGSHVEFDYFIVPVIKDEKSQRDTIKTIKQLKALGIDRKRIRVLFNQVDIDDDVEGDFSAIFGFCDMEKAAIANKNAVIYHNEVFDRTKSVGKPLGEISLDETDYRAQLRAAQSDEEKAAAVEMIQLKRLAVSANKNLDDAFAAVLK